jgi:hypothetical protein
VNAHTLTHLLPFYRLRTAPIGASSTVIANGVKAGHYLPNGSRVAQSAADSRIDAVARRPCYRRSCSGEFGIVAEWGSRRSGRNFPACAHALFDVDDQKLELIGTAAPFRVAFEEVTFTGRVV